MRMVLVMFMVLVGCGSTVCERLAEDQANFQRKIRPCLNPGEQLVGLDVQACEANIEQCTQAEIRSVEAGSSCVSGAQVPACRKGEESEFIQSVERCPEIDASDACFYGIYPRP